MFSSKIETSITPKVTLPEKFDIVEMLESFNKLDITCLNMYKCISVGPTLVQPIYKDFVQNYFCIQEIFKRTFKTGL